MSRIRLAGIAFVAVAGLLLSGCTVFDIARTAPTTSTPTGESVAPELERFYGQVIEWSPCDDEPELQCSSVIAPLDWQNPEGDTIELALARSYSWGDRLGSVLINPGGPGASGVDFVIDSLEYGTSDRLRDSYDIVGFDPRGVGRSSAVSCYDDPDEFTEYLYELPASPRGSDEWIDELEQGMADFGQACLEHTGELLGHVDTESAARDMDMLRAALGDEKLNYLGFSYGTLLGASYAGLFPEKTGRLVLDGAVDPTSSDFEVTATQAQGFESAFRAYVESCLGGSDCPFRGSTVDGVMTSVRVLLERLDQSPLRASDGRMLGSDAMTTAIILPLYSQSSWFALDQLFTDVAKGDADFAFQLADLYNDRNTDGSYSSNLMEAFTAINCLDYAVTSTREGLHDEAARLAELAPLFGPQMSYGGTGCAEWPFESSGTKAEIAAAGSAPILVVGTTNDPATPYSWAVALADQLENGHLVTYEGEGHTAYNSSNACVNDAVDDFFIDGVVPASDPLC